MTQATHECNSREAEVLGLYGDLNEAIAAARMESDLGQCATAIEYDSIDDYFVVLRTDAHHETQGISVAHYDAGQEWFYWEV